MREAACIDASPRGPVTRAMIAEDLAALCVAPGDTPLVHCAMRRLGWVCGGAQAVIKRLADAIGAAGTLVMPAHAADGAEPSDWHEPAVPESWHDIIRTRMPTNDDDPDAFAAVGAAFELREMPVRRGPVGHVETRLIDRATLVDFGARRLPESAVS